MSSRSLHRNSDPSSGVPAADTKHESTSSNIGIAVIVQSRYTFDTDLVSGKRIREMAHVPAGFALYRRMPGGNEPIADDAQVTLHNGDHFFARPSASAS